MGNKGGQAASAPSQIQGLSRSDVAMNLDEARQNVLADERLSRKDRETLLNSLNIDGSKSPEQVLQEFSGLYREMSMNERALKENKSREERTSLLADTPGLRAQTSGFLSPRKNQTPRGNA